MNPPPSSRLFLLVIAYLGFISLGLPDTLIGVAWPSVRDGFGRHQADIAAVFFGAAASYFLSSFFTGQWLRLLRIGSLLAVSSGIVALSVLGYASAATWFLFAPCSILHGLGSGAIDAGLNHYVANHFSARQMNWLHACYSIGATLGPLIMTWAIAGSGSWRSGYFTVSCILILLAVLFAMTRHHWDDGPEPVGQTTSGTSESGMGNAIRNSTVWLQIALFFVYTGTEATFGQWSFTVLTESRRVNPATAGAWVTLYWASIGVGRIVFGFIADRVGIDLLLRWATGAALVGAALFAWNGPGAWNPLALTLIGLGLAPIYPCLMTRTPQRIGVAMAAHAIGFQVGAATVGAAVLPSLSGFLAQNLTPQSVAVAGVLMVLIVTFLHEMLLRTSSPDNVLAGPGGGKD